MIFMTISLFTITYHDPKQMYTYTLHVAYVIEGFLPPVKWDDTLSPSPPLAAELLVLLYKLVLSVIGQLLAIAGTTWREKANAVTHQEHERVSWALLVGCAHDDAWPPPPATATHGGAAAKPVTHHPRTKLQSQRQYHQHRRRRRHPRRRRHTAEAARSRMAQCGVRLTALRRVGRLREVAISRSPGRSTGE